MGAPGQPQRPAAGGPHAVPLRQLYLGHDIDDPGVVRAVRPAVRDALVFPGRPRAGCARQRYAAVADDRRDDGRPGGRRPAREPAQGGRRPAGGEPRVNAKILVISGFGLIATALAMGALTSVHSSTGYAATWFAVTGLGLGMAMPAAMNAALSALSAERSGSGSAVITAMRQVGATIGVAVLGTVITSVYRSGLNVAALPGQA